jgi:hypothetical protein
MNVAKAGEAPAVLARLRSALAAGDLETACSELESWLSDGLVADYVNEQVERLIASPNYVPTMSMPYLRTDGLLIQVALAVPGSVPIFGKILRDSAEDVVLAVAGGGTMTFRVRELPDGINHDVFDRTVRLSPGRTHTLGRHQALPVRAGRDVLEIVSHHTPTVLVSAHGNPRFTTVWTFNGETLNPESQRAATLQDSRIEFGLRLLAHFSSPTSEGPIEALLEHPAHNVRWMAANALDRVAPHRTRDVLEILSCDPHPHVRSAAARALALRAG